MTSADNKQLFTLRSISVTNRRQNSPERNERWPKTLEVSAASLGSPIKKKETNPSKCRKS
jgi:hypothetical protein